MRSRKKRSAKPTSLPKDFLVTVSDLFNKQFKKERGVAEFLAFGDLYMDEVVLCVSLTHPKSLAAGTFYSSMDLAPGVQAKPEAVTDLLKNMVDITASWFSQCFTESKEKGVDALAEGLKEQPITWQKVAWEDNQIFVLLNRDNHVLENAADRFLKTKGFDPESEEFFDDDALAGLSGEDDDGDDEGPGHLH